MKTKAYLRLSLLIPFFVWVICTAIFVTWIKLLPDGPGFNGPEGPLMIILFPLMFYVFGIIGWLIPYLLLSVILFVWSFRNKADTLLRVFAWSPVVMAMFVLVFVNLLSIGTTSLTEFLSNPAATARDFLGSTALYVGLTLLWGYACVGIGYGIYKLLQHRGFMEDEETMVSVPLNETS